MAEPDVRRPLPVHRDHRRGLADNRYVYAVVSRRSRGVSVGVNLNPDKVCNFDCVYCQVDRTTPGADRDVDVERLGAELDFVLDLEKNTPRRQIAVLVPELVESRWHLRLMHNHRSTALKALLLFQGDKRITVINIPWYLTD